MNPDECRKELKPCAHCGCSNKDRDEGQPMVELDNDNVTGRWYVVCHGCGARSGLYQEQEKALDNWNSRTESKPVTREEIVMAFFRKFRMVPENEVASFDRAFDAIYALQLSAPQSPVVTLELQAPQSKVTRDELFTLLSAGVMAHKPELREQDGRYELDFSPTIGPLASDMMRFLEAKMMSAPQSPVVPTFSKPVPLEFVATEEHEPEQSSPVVPGVGDWIDLVSEGVEVGVSDAAIKATINQALSHIAHLLTTLSQSASIAPGVDLGWVRSVLLNMKPSEIDDTARLIFDTMATSGHQSREDDTIKKELDDLQRKAFNEYVDMANRYRQALERIASPVHVNTRDDAWQIARETIATTSPNDGSGRG